MNNNIIICIGISGSGKSTWCIQHLKENKEFLRVNRDSIRLTLIGDLTDYYKRKDLNNIEAIVTIQEGKMVASILNSGSSLLIDNTNLTHNYVSRWLGGELFYIDKYRSENIKFKFFDIDLDLAKARIRNRDSNIVVNTDYIDKQYKQYIEVKKWINEKYKDKII